MHNFLFTFESTHRALTAEKRLKESVRSGRLIPTPSEVHAECGFSLEIPLDEEALEGIFRGELFLFAACYVIIQSDPRRRRYEKIDP